jgi:hypothetical protein
VGCRLAEHDCRGNPAPEDALTERLLGKIGESFEAPGPQDAESGQLAEKSLNSDPCMTLLVRDSQLSGA